MHSTSSMFCHETRDFDLDRDVAGDVDCCGDVDCDCPACMPAGCMDEEIPADLLGDDVAPQAGDFVISHDDLQCPDIFAALERAMACYSEVGS